MSEYSVIHAERAWLEELIAAAGGEGEGGGVDLSLLVADFTYTRQGRRFEVSMIEVDAGNVNEAEGKKREWDKPAT